MRRNWTEGQISAMEWITKAENFRNNSVPVNQMFENQIESFFLVIFCSVKLIR